MTEHAYRLCGCGRLSLIRFTVQGGYATEKADPCPCAKGAPPLAPMKKDKPFRVAAPPTGDRVSPGRPCSVCGEPVGTTAPNATMCFTHRQETRKARNQAWQREYVRRNKR